jgi:[lysine-biosynthesis-protein LysW]--L-2-aminoadipate ligase
MTVRLALFHSTIRKEEKRLQDAALNRNVEIKLIDIRTQVFTPDAFTLDFDVALERSVSTVKGDYAVAFLESLGVPVVNTLPVARLCEDKFLTSLMLQRNGIPTPRFALAFDPEQARQAVGLIGGFPIVVKPALGSWGRLLAKVNDEDALEAILEHKEVLGTPPHKAFYLQEYVRKPGRDIRAFVVGAEVICAIYRESPHWITNTARGGRAWNCRVTPELQELCGRAASLLGGGLLAVDLFETDGGPTINEINHTMEFRNSEEPTGVDIAGAMVDYCVSLVDGSTERTVRSDAYGIAE